MMKKIILILIGMIILFCGIPFLVNFIVLTPSPVGFITPDKQGTWISFYGSLVGGVMTLFGVGWTITYTNSVRKEDQKKHDEEIRKEYEKRDFDNKKILSSQYKPILTISFDSNYIDDKPFGVSIYNGYYIQNIMSLVDNIESGKRLVISLLILNIGRGEARKLKISSSIISDDGEPWKTITRTYEEICVSNGININFYKNLNEEEWEKYDNKTLENPVNMSVKIEYFDLVGYRHTLESFITIKKFVHIKNENNELINNVIVLNPYDSIIQNTTSSEED